MTVENRNPARILVIEDNPADVYLLRHSFDQHGEYYEMEILADGEEAIHFVEQQRTSPDPEPCVIVLDLHLPKHDGKAVLEAIRKEPSLANVHVVALTSFATSVDEDELRQMGVRLCTTKPTELDEWVFLAGRILEICRERYAEALV